MTLGLGLDFVDDELEVSVRAGVADVEAALAQAVRADDEFVTVVAGHLIEAGGKRFRPLLAVLAAHFGDPLAPGVVPSAVVVELTHLATLYHDDVMDEAAVRRGAPSANSRWDNSVAILTGDFLFSRASNLLAELGPDAVRIQARTFERLVIGQIRETVGPAAGVDPVDHYLAVLAGKTGSLIATAAEFGAMFAGASAEVVDVMRRFGEEIGIAFQISDDILDIAAEPSSSGKTPGTDLREGVATLPVLYALKPDPAADADARPAGGECDDAESDHSRVPPTDAAGRRDTATRDGSAPHSSATPASVRLRHLVSRPITDDAEVAEALILLRESPALDHARDVLRAHADRARVLLGALPDVPARAALSALIELTVHRSR